LPVEPNRSKREEQPLFATLFASETKVALLVLFHGNPGLTDTSEGVARRIGRSGREVKPDLEDFTRLGILSRRKLGKETEVYSLDHSGDRRMQESLDTYFKGLAGPPPRGPRAS
jgi:hypothetical protein